MSGMLFLLFVQSLFQFGAKEGKLQDYYGGKIMPMVRLELATPGLQTQCSSH